MEDNGPDVLAALYDEYAKRLYAYACVLAKSRNDAEDIVQECFARLASRIKELKAVNDPESYLLKVVRNEAFRFRSRWLRWRSHNEAAGTVRLVQHSGDDATDREEAQRIERAMATLNSDQREVVYLKIWEHRTFAQIGDILGVSQNTAASRYRYGVEKLRELLGDE
jgi:RNA polymerase sigma-70 factor (ECF subfamily)